MHHFYNVCLVQRLLVLVTVMQFYELLSAQSCIADILQCWMGASENSHHKNARICGGPIKTNLITTIQLQRWRKCANCDLVVLALIINKCCTLQNPCYCWYGKSSEFHINNNNLYVHVGYLSCNFFPFCNVIHVCAANCVFHSRN